MVFRWSILQHLRAILTLVRVRSSIDACTVLAGRANISGAAFTSGRDSEFEVNSPSRSCDRETHILPLCAFQLVTIVPNVSRNPYNAVSLRVAYSWTPGDLVYQ